MEERIFAQYFDIALLPSFLCPNPMPPTTLFMETLPKILTQGLI